MKEEISFQSDGGAGGGRGSSNKGKMTMVVDNNGEYRLL